MEGLTDMAVWSNRSPPYWRWGLEIFANMFPPDSTSFNIAKQVVEGDIAYILWSGSSAYYSALLATDTFVMRDGKIAAQTLAAQLEAK